MLAANIGNRFVAFAVMGSKPTASSNGNETAAPDEATVVIKPQRKPAISTKLISSTPMSNSKPTAPLFCCLLTSHATSPQLALHGSNRHQSSTGVRSVLLGPLEDWRPYERNGNAVANVNRQNICDPIGGGSSQCRNGFTSSISLGFCSLFEWFTSGN